MDILQETITMLLLKIYPNLYGGVVFFKIATDGDFTTSTDKLFQASTTLLLKKYSLRQ